jgi:hypothetical protein
MTFADSDRPSWRTQERRALRDRAFLARVIGMRTAGDVAALQDLLFDHRFAAHWKVVAIKRALVAVAESKGVT